MSYIAKNSKAMIKYSVKQHNEFMDYNEVLTSSNIEVNVPLASRLDK